MNKFHPTPKDSVFSLGDGNMNQESIHAISSSIRGNEASQQEVQQFVNQMLPGSAAEQDVQINQEGPSSGVSDMGMSPSGRFS